MFIKNQLTTPKLQEPNEYEKKSHFIWKNFAFVGT